MKEDSLPSFNGGTKADRRLAAIMFTDMVGYTALAQKDETLALDLLEEHRKILRRILEEHGGQEIKTIGDAFLVEFDSALEATLCAYEIQSTFHESNVSTSPEARVKLRIGIHVGEVVSRGNDIYGDAVNVASRIEALAKAEEICLTQQVYDHIRNKVKFPIASLGKKDLKNVEYASEIYRIIPPWELKNKEESGSKMMLDSRRVAVLPLANMSSDPEDEYFSDGLTEELISAISQVPDLRVISRTSAMRFKKSTKGLGEIGRELNVGSIVEGSVRRAGKRIRITAQLIKVETDEHQWAKTYDRDFEDVFAIQSDIAQNVATALKIKLLENDRERLDRQSTRSEEAYTLYLKGRYFWNSRTKEAMYKSIELYEKAIENDPSFALAHVGIADCYSVLADHGHVPLKEGASRAKELAEKALLLNPSLAEAHASLGLALENLLDNLGAEREFKTAIKLNPNYASAHHWYATLLTGEEKIDEAISEARKATDLDPLSLQIRTYLAATYYYAKRYDEAEKNLLQVLEIEPDFFISHMWLAVVYAAESQFEKAVSSAVKGYEIKPTTRTKSALGYMYGIVGRKEEAMKILEELIQESQKSYVPYFDIASVCVGLKMFDKAIYWLEKAERERDELRSYNLMGAWLDPLKSDERFKKLKAKLEEKSLSQV